MGVSDTERYVKVQALIAELDSMSKAGLLTADEYKTRKMNALNSLDKASRRGGRRLINLFGLVF